jgi:Glycosyl transferases group 1
VAPLDERPILCFATQGTGHLDEVRIRELLSGLEGVEVYAFSRAGKARSGLGLFRAARARRPALIVMEGTGVAGGLAVIALRRLSGISYIVSSGDAVGPYLGLRGRLVGWVGERYERLLCRHSAGFIGWTPYLAGRALTFGAPRAISAPGWGRGAAAPDARERMRARIGVTPDTIVAGLVGSLAFNERVGYAYGLELVRAVRRVERPDVAVCVVGDGSGLERLREEAGEDLGRRVFLPGRVAPEEVPNWLAAFDLASLPQSVDRVGSFRYTTKLPEYLAAGLPVVSGQIPASYDLDRGQVYRLPGPAPWSEEYVGALAELLERVTGDELARRREAAESTWPEFDREAQRERVRAFVEDVLAEH